MTHEIPKIKIQITKQHDFDTIAPIIKEVQELHAQWYPKIYKPYEYHAIKHAMEKLLADEQMQLWVAQVQEIPVGYVFIMIRNIQENAFYHAHRLIHIDQIAVLNSNRSAGIGALLLKKVEQIAAELDIKRLELDHLHLNLNAAHFFTNQGFKPYRAKLYKDLTD